MFGMHVNFTLFDLVINLAFSLIATIGFALTINIPHRVISWSGICGMAGWMVYWFADRAGLGRMLSNMLGAFTVGLLSVLLAHWQKCPALLFSVPGLVPLVPGAPAYMAVRSLLDGNLPQAQQEVQRVAIVTASIALGVLLSTMFQDAMVKHLRRIHAREKKE